MKINPDELIDVATVCGNEVRIYASLDKRDESRTFLRKFVFNNYGQAKLYADEFEDLERQALKRRQK